MMKLKYFLSCFVVLVAVGIFLYLRPVEFYLMPINAWERKIWIIPSDTQKEDHYVVYNHLWKSEQKLMDSVLAFCDHTVSLDTIKKYHDGYSCFFFKRNMTLNKSYNETENSSDIIYDHLDSKILSIIWYVKSDIVDIYVNGDLYKVPFTEKNFDVITSVSQLKTHEDFLFNKYERIELPIN